MGWIKTKNHLTLLSLYIKNYIYSDPERCFQGNAFGKFFFSKPFMCAYCLVKLPQIKNPFLVNDT